MAGIIAKEMRTALRAVVAMLRYAIEKYPEPRRKAYLNGTV